MKRLIPILTVFLLNSCSSQYDKNQVTEYFKEVKELNRILINHIGQVRNSDGLQTFSQNIPESRDLIELLDQKLNLTKIELYNVDGKQPN